MSKTKYILIVGSGNGVEEWVKEHIEYINMFDEVIALNNAWYLMNKYNINFLWYHSTDFHIFGKLQPPHEIQQKTIKKYYDPYFKKKYGDKTVLEDMLVTVYSKYLFTPITVCIIGCDLDYSGNKTHFYGQGKQIPDVQRMLQYNEPSLVGKHADPLRFGKEFIINRLKNLQTDAYWVRFVNLSDNPNSLFPYTKIPVEQLFNKKKMEIDK